MRLLFHRQVRVNPSMGDVFGIVFNGGSEGELVCWGINIFLGIRMFHFGCQFIKEQ